MKTNLINFKKALTLCKKQIDAKGMMPVLAHVRLEGNGETLTLRATDLSSTLRVTMSCEGKLDAVIVDHKRLAAVCDAKGKKGTDEVTIALTWKPGIVYGKCDTEHPDLKSTWGEKSLCCTLARDHEGPHQLYAGIDLVEWEAPAKKHPPVPEEPMLTVMVGTRSFSLQARRATEFPAIPEFKKSKCGPIYGARELRDALEYVLPAVSSDETRSHLNRICLCDTRMVATNGHRLHLASDLPKIEQETHLPGGAACILKDTLKDALSSITVDLHEDKRSTWTVTSRTFQATLDICGQEAQFPPFEEVIPMEMDAKVRLQGETKILTEAVRMAQKISEGNSGMRLLIDGQVRIFVDASQDSSPSYAEILPLTSEGDLKIVINPWYVLEALDGIGDTFKFYNAGGPKAPNVFYSTDHKRLAVVMAYV